MKHVPTLNLQDFHTDEQRFVQQVGEAFKTFGFCCFTGHGIDPDLIKVAYAETKGFFDQFLEKKLETYIEGGAGTRGYTPFKIETAKTSNIPDLKEFYHVGREVTPFNNPYPDILMPNVWPKDKTAFRLAMNMLYQQLESLGEEVLEAMALSMGLERDTFSKITPDGNSILRLLHYPPISPKDYPAVRAEAHEDISFITLLVGATQAGLEIKTRTGEWLPITTQGDAIVVNVGDMMQRMTNHVFPSTTHRVVNPTDPELAQKSRYSMPFFMDPYPMYRIKTLPQCITEDNPDRYEGKSITAHEYLMERLAEIKLTPKDKDAST